MLLQVPSPRQRLIFQGRLLRDEDRLNDYGMTLFFLFISQLCSMSIHISLGSVVNTS